MRTKIEIAVLGHQKVSAKGNMKRIWKKTVRRAVTFVVVVAEEEKEEEEEEEKQEEEEEKVFWTF